MHRDAQINFIQKEHVSLLPFNYFNIRLDFHLHNSYSMRENLGEEDSSDRDVYIIKHDNHHSKCW